MVFDIDTSSDGVLELHLFILQPQLLVVRFLYLAHDTAHLGTPDPSKGFGERFLLINSIQGSMNVLA